MCVRSDEVRRIGGIDLRIGNGRKGEIEYCSMQGKCIRNYPKYGAVTQDEQDQESRKVIPLQTI